jgi:hypothetical protein
LNSISGIDNKGARSLSKGGATVRGTQSVSFTLVGVCAQNNELHKMGVARIAGAIPLYGGPQGGVVCQSRIKKHFFSKLLRP